jgi:hypothetical protein
MKALIDGDILRYEIGFGANTMASGSGLDWTPWRMVEDLLYARIDEIMKGCEATSYQLYLTEGRTFRYDLAKSRPYKGNRPDNKPGHFDNLTSHMIHIMGARVVRHIEADDQLAIDHLADPQTILCSRDKDLRQVPGYFYSWELGRQPSYRAEIGTYGHLQLEKGKLSGSGLCFFAAQVLMGDVTDNIPGLPGCGPVAAYKALKECQTPNDLVCTLEQMYQQEDEDYLLEQGRLCWITRRLNPDGTPVLWELEMTE